ncbi:hypothetical protein B0H13DRAFT_2034688, partial [Mycena leptocephala]
MLCLLPLFYMWLRAAYTRRLCPLDRQTALNGYGLCFFDASIELARVIVNKPNSTYASPYAHCNTHVWCTKGADNTTIPTDLRVYIT